MKFPGKGTEEGLGEQSASPARGWQGAFIFKVMQIRYNLIRIAPIYFQDRSRCLVEVNSKFLAIGQGLLSLQGPIQQDLGQEMVCIKAKITSFQLQLDALRSLAKTGIDLNVQGINHLDALLAEIVADLRFTAQAIVEAKPGAPLFLVDLMNVKPVTLQCQAKMQIFKQVMPSLGAVDQEQLQGFYAQAHTILTRNRPEKLASALDQIFQLLAQQSGWSLEPELIEIKYKNGTPVLQESPLGEFLAQINGLIVDVWQKGETDRLSLAVELRFLNLMIASPFYFTSADNLLIQLHGLRDKLEEQLAAVEEPAWTRNLTEKELVAIDFINSIGAQQLAELIWNKVSPALWALFLGSINDLLSCNQSFRPALVKICKEIIDPDTVAIGLINEVIILAGLANAASGNNRLTAISKDLDKIAYHSEIILFNEAGEPYGFQGREYQGSPEEVVIDGYRGKRQGVIEIKSCFKREGLTFSLVGEKEREEALKFRRQARKYAAMAKAKPDKIKSVEYHIVAPAGIDNAVLEFLDKTFAGVVALQIYCYLSSWDKKPDLVWECESPPANAGNDKSRNSFPALNFDSEPWEWALRTFSDCNTRKGFSGSPENIKKTVRNPNFYRAVCQGLQTLLDSVLAQKKIAPADRGLISALKERINEQAPFVVKESPSRSAIINFSELIVEARALARKYGK